MEGSSFQLFVLKITASKIQIKLFFALIISLCCTEFGFSQGAKLTPLDVKLNIDKLDRNIMGFSADIPSRFSMENMCRLFLTKGTPQLVLDFLPCITVCLQCTI